MWPLNAHNLSMTINPESKNFVSLGFKPGITSQLEITDTSVTVHHRRRGLVTSHGATPSSQCLFQPTCWRCGSTYIFLHIPPIQQHKGLCMSHPFSLYPCWDAAHSGACPRKAMAFGSGMPSSLLAIPFLPISLIGIPCTDGACPRG